MKYSKNRILEFISSFLVFLMIGCSALPGNTNRAQILNKKTLSIGEMNVSENGMWKNQFNSDSSYWEKIYLHEAIKINAAGDVFDGQSQIKKKLTNFKSKVGSIDTIFEMHQIMANQNPNYSYEIGGFITASNKIFKHLIIWKVENNFKLRELECIVESKTTNKLKSEIDPFRNKWMELCNQHNAYKLIEEMYTSNAIYYNHKPPNVGTESISIEYGYMNDTNYNLKLAPIVTEMVNDSISFEIGQCSGSYNGKYMIVWKFEKDGKWKVMLDSNI